MQFLIIKKMIADNKCYMEKKLDIFRLEKAKKDKIKKSEALNKTEISFRKRNEISLHKPSKVLKRSSKDINKSKNNTKEVNYNFN